ncbi:MAG TPA: sulfatase-like hydrolase/transferase [Caulobacteraceae bacterium]|nr:sulfatase-like hydrolase/transferase [Caulobacteraceae bacterium]
MAFGRLSSIAKTFLALVGVTLALGVTACQREREAQVLPRSQIETRPNVLVFLVDALGPELGAYGDPAAVTPVIDGLAKDGVTFASAYAASGSDGAAWASLMTGMHPQTLGVVQDWTNGRGWPVAPQPEVKAFPELLRQAGYYTFRTGPFHEPLGGTSALWDLNLREAGETWPRTDIPQPFLGVVEISTLPEDAGAPTSKKRKGFFESVFEDKDDAPKPVAIDAAKISLPPYLSPTPALRGALATRYQRIAAIDAQIGETLKRLEASGALNNTIVIVTARTGPPWPRAERTLYDSGVRIPLIVRYPDRRQNGVVSRALFSGVDLAPSVLKLVGMEPMAWMQGRDRLSVTPAPAADFVFAIQNRVGSVFERSRAVRDGRFLFIRNESVDTRLLDLARRGAFYDAVAAQGGAPSLGPNQTHPRAEIELYDLRADPHQLKNLAADPGRLAEIQRLAAALGAFNAMTPDLSTATTQELRDRFRPAGQTPATAPPTVREVDGQIVMERLTPGSAILWRVGEKDSWKLYRAPIGVPEGGKLEVKATRYGFRDSVVQPFQAKVEK